MKVFLFTPFFSLLRLWEPSGWMQRKISRRSIHLAPSETVWNSSYEGFSVYPLFSLLRRWEPSGGMERKILSRSVHLARSEKVWGSSYEGFSVYTLFQPSQALGAFWFDAV